jgi:hypothetical protein
MLSNPTSVGSETVLAFASRADSLGIKLLLMVALTASSSVLDLLSPMAEEEDDEDSCSGGTDDQATRNDRAPTRTTTCPRKNTALVTGPENDMRRSTVI